MEFSRGHVEEVRPQSCPELAAELVAAGLPVDDLTYPGRRFFRFWDHDAEPIGFIGVEALAPGSALLRSLVVLPGQRGRSYARPMMDWLLRRLVREGVVDAWVLTISIGEFAERLGFARVERDQTPSFIRASRQFAKLCPDTAVLLHRHLP